MGKNKKIRGSLEVEGKENPEVIGRTQIAIRSKGNRSPVVPSARRRVGKQTETGRENRQGTFTTKSAESKRGNSKR